MLIIILICALLWLEFWDMPAGIFWKNKAQFCEAKSHRIVQDALKEAENKRKELLIEAKRSTFKRKDIFLKRVKGTPPGLQNTERRLVQKEEQLEKRMEDLEKEDKALQVRVQESSEKEEELRREFERYNRELERISGMTSDEAKDLLLKNLENEVKFEATKLINKIEEEAKRTAEKKAKRLLSRQFKELFRGDFRKHSYYRISSFR